MKAKVTKLKLSYFKHIKRRQVLGKYNNAGKTEGSRQKEKTKHEMG